MCELGGLGLVMCSDNIESVSLSGANKLQIQGELTSETFLSQYCNRKECLDMSLHKYYHYCKNIKRRKKNDQRPTIPHYVGGSSQPKFPISQSYARSIIMIHKPWSKNNPLPQDHDFINAFNTFIDTDTCPLSVKITYERAKKREEDKKLGRNEPISEDREESTSTDNLYDDEVRDAIALTATLGDTMNILDYIGGEQMDFGLNYNWAQRLYTVSIETLNLCSFG
jgi:hypothetical protein